MKFIGLALLSYTAQWVALPFVDDQWTFLLGMSTLPAALLVTGVCRLCVTSSVLIRSVLTLWAIFAWGDVVKFMAWNYFDSHIDTSVPMALVFAAWLMLLVRRRYDRKSDLVRDGYVTLLIKRPDGMLDMVKSLFGAPIPSICVCIGDDVWSFRRRTGTFKLFQINARIRDTHVCVDTGIRATGWERYLLNDLVGTPRGMIPCKCVWVLDDLLPLLGGKYAIRSWFDYIPGIYAMRVL